MESNLFRYVWTHSRRDQIVVLLLIAASLPFYWLSLEIPKRIVNEALLGGAFRDGVTEARLFELSIPVPPSWGGPLVISEGFLFDQIDFLLALSFLFLFFVLLNGAFKYGINLLKGILAERMMRRLRFELFTTMMRFRPEDLRAVKPAEAASMIKDEVEPIGGFTGDAFIQPAFLSTQALTALIFIMVQSFWLGLVALSVVLVQAIVIPYLRREQLRLGRMRQIAARQLAGRIGEMVDGSRTIQSYGLKRFSDAEIGSRLGNLFKIRTDLYKRKFAVKYLNTLLAQTTPFFFYAIGGYLALRGTLDLGQLVAAIAAYRDLPPPIKELIDWEQRRADASIKYEQVIAQFSGRELLPDDLAEPAHVGGADQDPIVVTDLTVTDQRGQPLIAGATFTIDRPANVALIGTAGSGRDILARAMGRQITKYDGRVAIGERDLRTLAFLEVASMISYVPPEPELFAGSIRDNIVLSLLHNTPQAVDLSEWRWQEAQRTGNPLCDEAADWCDYAAAGVSGHDELEDKLIELLRALPIGRDLYNYGLKGQLPDNTPNALKEKVIRARHEIQDRLGAAGLNQLVEHFDVTKFNPHATLGENIVFGASASDRFGGSEVAVDPYLRSVIADQALSDRLVDIGLRIADTVVEVFSDLPSGHPLFERFSMIRASELELFADIVEEADADKPNRGLSDTAVDRLISLALGYIEPRHRLGLVTPELEEQILSARQYFRDHCPEDIIDQIEFYDAAQVMDAAPIGDNLLFGRVAHNVANAEQRIASFLKDVLPALDMERLVYSIGLDFDVGSHGQALFAPQRAAISIARGLIQRPQILILEDALKAFSEEQRDLVLSTVGRWMHGKTLILTATEVPPAIPFNLEVQVDETRVRVSEALQEDAGDQVNASEISSRDSGPGGAIADPLTNAKAK